MGVSPLAALASLEQPILQSWSTRPVVMPSIPITHHELLNQLGKLHLLGCAPAATPPAASHMPDVQLLMCLMRPNL